MKCLPLCLLALLPVSAAETRVLVDGTGCRTRQLAIARIFEGIPGVQSVEVQPRKAAPKLNQRYFLINSSGNGPTQNQLVQALGKRAKHYQILSVTPHDPALSGSR